MKKREVKTLIEWLDSALTFQEELCDPDLDLSMTRLAALKEDIVPMIFQLNGLFRDADLEEVAHAIRDLHEIGLCVCPSCSMKKLYIEFSLEHKPFVERNLVCANCGAMLEMLDLTIEFAHEK